MIPESQYREMLLRLEGNKRRNGPVPVPEDAAERETGQGGLHNQIIDFCNAQWPKWKYIAARVDRKSTIAVGAHDITCFLPNGKVLCIELKAKAGKLSQDQMNWQMELKMLGHTVHVVRSLEEFLCLTKIQ